MRHPLTYPRRVQLDQLASSAGCGASLALPLALLHARAAAEMLIACIDLVFLMHVWLTRDLPGLRPFAWAALAWWIWLVICSALGTGGLLLGLLAIRLPVLSVALAEWLLTAPGAARRGRWLWIVLAAAFAWIALECWQQYLTGVNLFGQGRWTDGALTGPFNKPRAGPAFILLFFPVLIPAAAALGGAGRWRRAAGMMLAALGVLTMVLIGQRMPFVLMLLGLAATALLVPRLRLAMAAAGVLGCLLLAALPLLSPAANAKLVVQFADQLRHFAQSDYGLIYTRATVLAQLHPWLGLGFDGYRRGCSDPAAMHGIAWLGVLTDKLNGGLAACNLHPHNYYLEAADNAGLPGLLLFAAMVATALRQLGRGVLRSPQSLRVGLLVGALIALWPLASTSSLTSMPNGGWLFLMLGLGFAMAGGERRLQLPV